MRRVFSLLAEQGCSGVCCLSEPAVGSASQAIEHHHHRSPIQRLVTTSAVQLTAPHVASLPVSCVRAAILSIRSSKYVIATSFCLKRGGESCRKELYVRCLLNMPRNFLVELTRKTSWINYKVWDLYDSMSVDFGLDHPIPEGYIYTGTCPSR
jgi:hypothetical protein